MMLKLHKDFPMAEPPLFPPRADRHEVVRRQS
jgi:hypothetical protein